MKLTKLDNLRMWIAIKILPVNAKMKILEMISLIDAASDKGIFIFGSAEAAANSLIHLREDQVIKDEIKEEEIN